jgi:hypothetical protein
MMRDEIGYEPMGGASADKRRDQAADMSSARIWICSGAEDEAFKKE